MKSSSGQRSMPWSAHSPKSKGIAQSPILTKEPNKAHGPQLEKLSADEFLAQANVLIRRSLSPGPQSQPPSVAKQETEKMSGNWKISCKMNLMLTFPLSPSFTNTSHSTGLNAKATESREATAMEEVAVESSCGLTQR